MTIASHFYTAIFIAGLIACVLGDKPPVVITQVSMQLKEEDLPIYLESSFELVDEVVFDYNERIQPEPIYIYPLFLTADFVVQNEGEKELSFLYSSSLTNTSDTNFELPEFSFEPENGESSIPPGGNVTFKFKYDSEYTGEEVFNGLLLVFMVFKEGDVVYEPISFRAATDVAVPGCSDECNDKGIGKGTCIDIIGHCHCEEPWTSVTCQSSFKLWNTEICPGEPMNVTYAFVSTTCEGYWSINEQDSDEDSYDTGDLFSPGCVKGSFVNETRITVITYLEPGDYRFLYYPKYGVDEDGEALFHVKSWEECGGFSRCKEDGDCSGHGKCVKGECECSDSHFWQDCSRGCDHEVRLHSRTGIIDSDSGSEKENDNPLYIPFTECTWFIEPEGSGIDEIHLSFERFKLGSSLDSLMVRSISRGGVIDRNSRLLATYFDDGNLPPEKNFTEKSIALVFTTTYQGCSLGFRVNYTVITKPLSGGAIAGISIAIIVAVICLIGLLVFLLFRRNRRRNEALNFAKLAHSEPWTLGIGEDEDVKNDRNIGKDGAMPERSELEKILGWMDMKELEFECSDYELRFGLEERMPCPVMVEQKQVITITNGSDLPLAFCFFHPVDDNTMQCSIVPGKGTLAPNTGIRVQVTLKLMYTTRLDISIKCSVWRGARGPGEFYAFATSDGLAAPGPNAKPVGEGAVDPVHQFQEQLAKSKPLKSARLIVHLEGAVSERIDPSEVVLNPEPLGEGAYGVVYSGRYRGRYVAVKVMSRQHDLLEQITKDFEKEIDLYRRLHHPLIVEFVGASLIPSKLCMCTELIQRGSLDQLMSEAEIPLALQLRFAKNIAEAVAFLHSNNVMHRDLKPSNVMVVSTSLNSKVNCKIGDFGTARNVKDVTEFFLYTQGQGTPVFMAPEMLAVKPYNCKADVYSYAITLWQMAAREKPWANIPIWDIPTRVIHGKRPQIPDNIPKDYADIIRKCWAPNPNDRPAFSEILDLLNPIAKRAKKECKKEGGGKGMRKHVGGVAESTVDFTMTLEESVRNQGSTTPTGTDTTATAKTATATNTLDDSKKEELPDKDDNNDNN